MVYCYGTIKKGFDPYMNFKSALKRIAVSSCVLFSIITAIYALCIIIVTVDDDGIYLEAGRTLLFFLFSVLVSFANEFLKFDKISAALRYVVHYILFCFAVYSALLLPAGMSGNRVVVGIVIFSVIYIIVMTVRALVLSKLKVNSANVEEYQKQFSKKSK